MTILLSEDFQRQIRAHGEATYPEECGGLLLGNRLGDQLSIERVISLENVRAESRHNRVELDPLEYARAEREAARAGLGVWGYYHSHPDHPAVPSQFDLENAPFVGWSYVIVSIYKGAAADLRSWRLQEDRSGFTEESVSKGEQLG